ncbi:MAG TPA: class I SAM-dependent methyltransferase [Polyangiaceae bacterium]|nr:class I SAM-dependent methyltransferase [Polyangiaceae bacterium]
MSWFGACIYDRVMSATEDACLAAWRREILAGVCGTVCEIGAGTGVNLAHYPKGYDRLLLTEPDRHMRKKLEQRADGRAHVEVIDAGATRLPIDSGAVDTVVSTLVLCSVEDPGAVLSEARRVLRPGGQLLFLEHVASDDADRLRWQRRIEPIWKRLAGNCHLTRRTEELIESAGFSVHEVQRESMRKAFPFVRPTVRGSAIKS